MINWTEKCITEWCDLVEIAEKAPQLNPLGYEKIGKLILKFAIPAVASNLVNTIYNVTDQVVIGHGIGYDGIAATTVAFPLSTLTTAITLLIAIGTASNFNLKQGAGDKKGAEKIAAAGLSLSVISGVVLAILAFIFLRPLLNAFGANAEIFDMAYLYTFITIFGIPFQVFSMTAGHLIRADGSPTWTMLCIMSGAVFNIIADPIAMFALGWGIWGVALATAIGPVISSALAIRYLLRGMKTINLKFDSLIPKWISVKSIAILGVSGFGNMIAMTIVNIVLNNTLNYYGDQSRYGSTIALGAVGAVTKIGTVFIAFVGGIGQGSQPIIGFNYGARKYDRSMLTIKTTMTAGTIIATLIFACFQLFPRQIISIFGQGSPEYFEFAERYLRIYLFMTFANAFQPMTGGYFTSTGRGVVGMVITMTRQIILLLPLLIILPMFLGIDGVVFAGPISDSIAAAISIFVMTREFKRIKSLPPESLPVPADV